MTTAIETPPNPPAITAPNPPPEPTEEPISFPNKGLFASRLKQAENSRLKELFGTSDLVEIEKIKAAAAELTERKKGELTEVERAKAEAATEKQRATQLQAQLDRNTFETNVVRACAQLGIKNVAYAEYEIDRARRDNTELDFNEHLKALLKTPAGPAALGIDQPIVTQETPVTTSPVGSGRPPTPPATNQPAPERDAFKMDQQTYRQELAKLGV